MESSPVMTTPPPPAAAESGLPVDAFLVEALQNPRHRLSVLRMEMDIQKFLQNPHMGQFEFPYFPTSYLRCCAHRVAQHYGMETMSLGSIVDGLGCRVVALKTPTTGFPALCLSQVPVQQPETERESPENMKIAVRPKLNKGSPDVATELAKNGGARTVEERKEEYDKARARIFGSLETPEEEETSPPQCAVEVKGAPPAADEAAGQKNKEEVERTARVGGSTVAIFRDREKERSDPDFDRSYVRYARGVPVGQNQNYGLGSGAVLSPSYVCYEAEMPRYAPMPMNQAPPVNYNLPNAAMNPYPAYMGGDPNDAVYMQWPSHAHMTAANSLDVFTRPNFQVQFYHQQPVSYEYTQHC